LRLLRVITLFLLASYLGEIRMTTNTCPECNQPGRPVETQTVKALLSVTLHRVHEGYLFCETPTCPIVYFSASGSHTFAKNEIRERIFQKDPDAQDVLICYCFQHTTGELLSASDQQRMDILSDITTGTKTGQCACDLRNPQGDCCLGNVRRFLKQHPTQSIPLNQE
jgi:hypothetical protein